MKRKSILMVNRPLVDQINRLLSVLGRNDEVAFAHKHVV